MKKSSTTNLAVLGVFSALIILLTFTPIGYIAIPALGISATIIHLPVIIGAVVLGPRDGAILGGVWGITALIRAAVMPNGPLDMLFVNPLVSVVPRILVGLCAAWVFRGLMKLLQKHPHGDLPAAAVAGAAGALTNTILVLGILCLCYRSQMLGSGNGTTIGLIIGTILTFNGLIEIGSAVLLTPAISRALFQVKKRARQ